MLVRERWSIDAGKVIYESECLRGNKRCHGVTLGQVEERTVQPVERRGTKAKRRCDQLAEIPPDLLIVLA